MAASSSKQPAPAQEAPASHPYTCNSCHVAFRNGDLQKGHMKGDWHRYNLKRRVAGLAPITSEVFSEKVLQARATTTAQADKVGFERVCDVCQKTYYSENSYQNHVSSQKHRAKAAQMTRKQGSVVDDEASSMMSSTFSLGEPQSAVNAEVDTDAEEEFTHVIEGLKNANLQDRSSPVKRPSNPHLSAAGQHKTDHPVDQASSDRPSSSATPTPSKSSAPAASNKSCLFCNYHSPTLALNAAHMERFHGLFIPERDYLVDMAGLFDMLQKQIRENFECIYCGKAKSDVFAVQTHMRDKAHCKIPYTTVDEQVEIGDFYDFRATYSDSEPDEESVDGDRQNGGVKLGAQRATITTGLDGDEIMNDDGWETDSSASSLDSEDLHAVPADHHYHQYERLDKHPHHSQTDPRAHHQKDGWHSHAHKHNHAVFYDEYELHLPSGKSVGHRSFDRYYRQNLRHYPTPEERQEQERLAIEAGEGDRMDLDGESGAVTNTRPSRERDLAARARGRPTNSWAVARNAEVGDPARKPALAKIRAQERTMAKRNVRDTVRATKMRGYGGSLKRPMSGIANPHG